MSIIGHSIQSGVVNVQMALKDQQAAQAAQIDEDERRQASLRRAEELAREGIVETGETRQTRVQRPPDRERKSDNKHEGSDGSEEENPEGEGGHLDLFA